MRACMCFATLQRNVMYSIKQNIKHTLVFFFLIYSAVTSKVHMY